MMMQFEQLRGRKFKVVVLTRPDLQYITDMLRNLTWVPKWVSEGHVAHQTDFWVAMPRVLADRFYNFGKVLTCSPAEHFCCRKIDRSESLWEYLTGAVHGPFWPCSCSNITTPSKTAQVGKILRKADL